MGARDVIYCLAYAAAVYLVYKTLATAKAILYPTSFWHFVGLIGWGIPGLLVAKALEPTPQPVLDEELLASALVGGYMLLKVDAADVASAVKQLSSAAVSALVGGVSG